VVYVADGAINNAKGTLGGFGGARIRNYHRKVDGELIELPACKDIILKPGEKIISYSAGGGGYGPPIERPAAHLKNDVEEGWISKQRAYEVYGVVLREDGSIDETATTERRRALRKGGLRTTPI